MATATAARPRIAPPATVARQQMLIGGKWVAPVRGQYFDNITPTTGRAVCQMARSSAEDIDLALDAGALRFRKGLQTLIDKEQIAA
mgnify:CR=1 FL=1